MKKLILIIIGLGLFVTAAIADVRFEVVYTDEAGTGFHVRPEARKSFEEAAALVGSWLDHDADVRIEVNSVVDAEDNYLACAGSASAKVRVIPGIYKTKLARKIIFNESSGEDYDALVMVNFYREEAYGYGDEVGSDRYDFKAIIIHELTHALGFASFIEREDEEDENTSLESVYLYWQNLGEAKDSKDEEFLNGILGVGVPIDDILLNWKLIDSGAESLTYFDTFLMDREGNKVVDAEKMKFLRQDLFELEEGDPKRYLYFPGSAFEEDGVGYRLNGMDGSHFEDGTSMVMKHAVLPGPNLREWSNVERDIMAALGYRLKRKGWFQDNLEV